jgi:hypothetical protein
MTEFSVRQGDVTEVPSDLLLLKFAQRFCGADKAVASRLIAQGVCKEADLQPDPGDFTIVETEGAIAPRRVMLLGTPPPSSLTYNEMEIFGLRAIKTIADLRLTVRSMTTIVHGTGYGLDGGEALERLVRGFEEGLCRHESLDIRTITFLALKERSVRMLISALDAVQNRPDKLISESAVGGQPLSEGGPVGAPQETPSGTEAIPGWASVSPRAGSLGKKRVFVAMPFSEEFENVYEFGIYPAVRNCGYICERVDETHFTGDVLGRIRGGIEAADLVVADLTEGRPNVYLEVGYAWGRGVPVIFVARKGESLHFDVSTHRCIFYGRFTQFAKELEALLRGIDATR